MSEHSNIDWESIDKLKRGDLQKLCKDLKIDIKGTSKNVDLISALLEYKQQQSTIDTTTTTNTEEQPQTIKNISSSNHDTDNISNVNKDKKEQKQQKNVDNQNTVLNDNDEQQLQHHQEQEQIQKEEQQEQKEKQQDEKKEEQKQEEEQKQKEQMNINNENSGNGNEINEVKEIVNEKEEQLKFIEQLKMNDENKEIEMNNETESEKIVHIGLKFRNYVPKEQSFLKYKIEKATAPTIAQELMSRLKVLEENQDIQISFVPKKVNWDLKRDCSKKLQKLEKQTEKAIYQLIKQKLGKEDINDHSNLYLLNKNMEKLNNY